MCSTSLCSHLPRSEENHCLYHKAFPELQLAAWKGQWEWGAEEEGEAEQRGKPRFLRCSLGRILDARPWQVTWAWAAFLAAGGGGVASEGRRWAPRSQGPHGLSCTLTYHMMPSNCLWVARVGDTSLGGVPFTLNRA